MPAIAALDRARLRGSRMPTLDDADDAGRVENDGGRGEDDDGGGQDGCSCRCPRAVRACGRCLYRICQYRRMLSEGVA
eukprot:2602292-Rhodomonas_salina.1